MRLGEWKRLLLSVDSWDYQQMVRIIIPYYRKLSA